MKAIEKQLRTNGISLDKKDKNKLPDSLLYPPEEDIYRKFHKESDIDPEDISKKKAPVEINNISELNQKEFDEAMSGSDLDIPGSEFDDELEIAGNEDEENGLYSIGGDSHTNLEENS
ncbi:hypothetical protein [Flavobacterium gilvum]|uniref:Uncharacterized protein n=1 Tax=Flavobacterium gilvum TaxID=1492737 RepID=A0AAC9I3J8_9FLAO|nr:hypothetical protein [Flavobacterium gilvum]AOW10224.1 hypothetical protein EM308_12295 [Flavobacterium gilvum]KFC58654.1 hypothetical protein FEM08_25980 [Flavobacterium gilvum]